MLKVSRKPIEVDVLIVGGGIAGLMAAIHAADLGARVLIAEKANTRRGGSGATGNDHFSCYIPEVHGSDIQPTVWEDLHGMHGIFQDVSMVRASLSQTFDCIKHWMSWGIPMKVNGRWEFTGHAFPGRPRIFLKYEGADQKAVLTEQAKKRGVIIENHLPITDLILKEKRVIGAIGIGTREEEPVLKIFRAKSVVLATGSANRLYPTVTPGLMFNTAFCPSDTGTGRAMAYRAGAKLVNMEMPNRHAGPKYLSRSGKATWIGVYTDPAGRPVGPFVTKPTRELGDITADVWNSVFTDMHRSGKGPVYIDCTNIADEDHQYMMWGFKHEGQTAMINYMREEKIDLRKHRVEFMQYEPFLVAGRGIDIDVKGETNIEGLFAAGDEVGNFRAGISGATSFGWIAGGSAAEKAKKARGFEKAEQSPAVEEWTDPLSNIMKRKTGPTWKEANLALQQIMADYAGTDVRSETLLKAGLKYLGDLKKKVTETVVAENSHTLMRVLEVLDLMECGETVFLTALERKETRGAHKRSDFPFTNPLLQDKFLNIWKESGRALMEWREKR